MGVVLRRSWGRGAGALVLGIVVAVLAAPNAPAAPAAPAADKIVYAALGDSYTSGPLVLPHDESRVPQDCGQSYFNYPHVAAGLLANIELRDVSCGSATIEDFANPQTGLPLGNTNPPQHRVLDASVDVVSVGIGGNDVGFTGLAMDCIRLVGPPTEQKCSPDDDLGENDPVTQDIKAMGIELGAALEVIHDLAPNAVLLVVSYPTAMPDNGVACWPYVPILQDDMPYLVAKFKEMNAELETQAVAHGATYVDIYTPSIGHDVCQPPPIAWVNGVVVVPPSFPAHPNQLGLAASGRVVADTIAAATGATPALALPVDPAVPFEPDADTARAGGASLPATGRDADLLLPSVLIVGAVGATRFARAGRARG